MNRFDCIKIGCPHYYKSNKLKVKNGLALFEPRYQCTKWCRDIKDVKECEMLSKS